MSIGIKEKIRTININGENIPVKKPTMGIPSVDDLEKWIHEGECQATDGCIVEPDGVCEHGHVSWLLYYDII